VHRQAEYCVGKFMCNGEVLARCRGKPLVGAELADEGIEVAASEDVGLLHLLIERIARLAEPLRIYEDREVAVVVAHSGHVVEEADTLNVAQCLTVGVGHFLTGGYRRIHLTEIEESVG